jgi:uncharacterized membrane protein HdeD (DUF308 family)
METSTALKSLTRNWWVYVLHGVAAVLFGIAAFVWPGLTLFVLVALYGAYAIVEGAISLVGAFRSGGGFRWSLLLWGLLGIAAGIVAFVWPGITALALVYVIAVWAIAKGIVQIAAAVRMRREIKGEWLLGLVGLLSIAFGLLLAAFPGAGALSLVWLIGAYAIVAGVAMAALGLRLRRMDRAAERAGRQPAPRGPTPASG